MRIYGYCSPSTGPLKAASETPLPQVGKLSMASFYSSDKDRWLATSWVPQTCVWHGDGNPWSDLRERSRW
jgi:hypothetical protein